MDILAGIAAAKGALDIAGALRRTEKNLDAATFRSQLTDLIEKLVDARLALVEAKEALADRESTIGDLKESFKTSAKLVRGDLDYKYILNESGERSGFPVCPKCEAISQRFVQLKQNVHLEAGKCPACDTEFRPVTCYIPPSENSGAETTTVAEYRAAERRRQAERNRKIAGLNRGF